MIRISNPQRRARVVARHHLDGSAPDVVAAAGSVVGLHATDPATVHLSARARVHGLSRSDVEAALYDERSILRLLGMRRTMFVVPTPVAPVIHEGATRALAGRERRRTIKMIEDGAIADDGAVWLAAASRRTLKALAAGPATAAELTRAVPELAAKVTFYKTDGSVLGVAGMSTRVLFLLATEGKVIRGRPRGSWRSSQYEWASIEQWVGAPLPRMPVAEARAALIAAYLHSFGPVTELDARWWTGWPLGQVRAALAAVGAVEVGLDAGTGYVLPDDAEPDPRRRSVALLPALDATTMGWKDRHWYLGDHGAALFDRNGNAGPTIWVDGRIVGGWAVTPSASVAWRVLQPIPGDRLGAVERAANEVEAWLDGSPVIPRFRTPLEQELGS